MQVCTSKLLSSGCPSLDSNASFLERFVLPVMPRASFSPGATAGLQKTQSSRRSLPMLLTLTWGTSSNIFFLFPPKNSRLRPCWLEIQLGKAVTDL